MHNILQLSALIHRNQHDGHAHTVRPLANHSSEQFVVRASKYVYIGTEGRRRGA